MLPDIPVKLLDQPVFLKQGNELSRSQKPKPGMVPADERLRAGRPAVIGMQVELRLQVDTKLLIPDSISKVADQPILIQFLPVDRIIIPGDLLPESAPDRSSLSTLEYTPIRSRT